MFQEYPIVHALAARDALALLPTSVRNIADTYRWPEDPSKKNVYGAGYRRSTKPVINQLNPVLEDYLLAPIADALRDPEAHHFDVVNRTGKLPAELSGAFVAAKSVLPGMCRDLSDLHRALAGLGRATHWLVDSWNPFQLSSGPEAEGLSSRFLEDVASHPDDLPFLWGRRDPGTITGHPAMDPKTAAMEMEYRQRTYLEPIGDCYLIGNGWPAAKARIAGWWNEMINAIATAWIFLCK